MKPNQIKIVSNSKGVSYFFRNEKSEWGLVSNMSDLSRKKYVSATIKKNAVEILQAINDIYNIGNRGVDIYLEGSVEDYIILQKVIKERFLNDNLHCYQQKISIAVAGKIRSGKTTLIKEIIKRQKMEFRFFRNNMIDGYTNIESTVTWYEIPGIDFGKENIFAAMSQFDLLAKNGVTNFIYCFDTNKIEELEEQFICYIQEKYPRIKILIVFTMCFEDDNVSILSKQLLTKIRDIKIIPVLAKELKTREGIISAYGLDEIVHYIFEGNLS